MEIACLAVGLGFSMWKDVFQKLIKELSGSGAAMIWFFFGAGVILIVSRLIYLLFVWVFNL